MEGGFFMKFLKSTPVEDHTYEELKENLQQASNDLKVLYTNMSNVLDPDLIDYYIYQTKAMQMRYKYLLESVKKIEDSYTKNPL